MGMLTTNIYVKIAEKSVSQTILGKHAFYGFFNQSVGLFIHHLAGSGKTLATGVTRMTGVNLVLHLVAGKLDLLSIDDDHIVTAINVRSVVGLVLATDDLGYLGCKAAKYLVFCINKYPFLIDGVLVGRYGFVT